MIKICTLLSLIIYWLHKNMANAVICNEDDNPSITSKIRLKIYKGNTDNNWDIYPRENSRTKRGYLTSDSTHIFEIWNNYKSVIPRKLKKALKNRKKLEIEDQGDKRTSNSSHFISSESLLTNPGSIADSILTNRDSILYVHGFMENTEADNVQIIIRAYLDKGDVNVIVLDWGDVAIDINYVYVASQVAMIGKAVAESLKKLAELINLNTLHVIGHSLGAHVAGHIGRFVNFTLTRITCLDPALPLFYPSACHVRSTDAEAVVILHTDGGFYGTPIDTGTIDFYANKGISPQPGCPIIIGVELCSHQRSVKIYVESLKNPKAFLAHKCFDKILQNRKNDVEVYFGDSTPKNIYGSYCFNTNSKSPYGNGT